MGQGLPPSGRGRSLRRNDTLIRQGDCARVMGHFLNLQTGRNVILMGDTILRSGSEKGFIQAISLADAKPVWDRAFNSKLPFNGLAVTDGNIVASFNDGSVAFLQKR